MQPNLLAYVQAQTRVGVDLMARDRSMVHVFDVGKTADGQEFVMVMAIIPKALVECLPTIPSVPLSSIRR